MTHHDTTRAHDHAQTFFEGYRDALLSRDAEAIASRYHLPALIAFPETTIAVTSADQTRDFFTQAVGQYAEVESATASITVLGATSHSIWADVAWSYEGAHPGERMVYQLLATEDGWRIGVLTPC